MKFICSGEREFSTMKWGGGGSEPFIEKLRGMKLDLEERFKILETADQCLEFRSCTM